MTKSIQRGSLYTELTERELTNAARHGDAAAFAELWQRTHRLAYAVVRARTHSEVEDIVASAYASVWEQLRSGGGPRETFKAYIVQTARNIAARTMRASLTTLTGVDVEPHPVSDVSEDLERNQLREDLSGALAQLPELWQQVIWWKEVELLGRGDIAKRLGMSANAVSALSGRAREGLREAWLRVRLADLPQTEHSSVVELFPEFVRGSLSDNRTLVLTRHLASCAPCSQHLREFRSENPRLSRETYAAGYPAGRLVRAA